MTDQELQEALKPEMRAAELQRRNARRKILLYHAELEHEFLSVADHQAHTAAVASLKRQTEAFEREITPSYWRRLLNALLAR